MLDMLTLDILLLDTCHLHANNWHLPVLLNNWCVITWHDTTWHLLLLCYLLSPVLSYDMTYHLSPAWSFVIVILKPDTCDD